MKNCCSQLGMCSHTCVEHLLDCRLVQAGPAYCRQCHPEQRAARKKPVRHVPVWFLPTLLLGVLTSASLDDRMYTARSNKLSPPTQFPSPHGVYHTKGQTRTVDKQASRQFSALKNVRIKEYKQLQINQYKEISYFLLNKY